MSTLSQLKVLDDADEYQKILNKLPKHIQEKWKIYIDKWLYNEDNEQIRDEYPPFSKLCQFISKQARIACNPLSARLGESKAIDKKSVRNKVQSFASQVSKVATKPVNSTSQSSKAVPKPVSCASQANPVNTKQAENREIKKKPDESSKCLLCEE